jgi:DNA-binding NtrC family response regulator
MPLATTDGMSDGASILVIDDEPHVSDMLQEYFAELGYTVGVAKTGEAAQRCVSAGRPDAILLDMHLPDTTGEQLLAKLLALDASLPIVMLSGDLDRELAQRTLAAGAFRYLQKPFDFDELEQTVARAVEASREDCVVR